MSKFVVEDLGRMNSGKIGIMDSKVIMLRFGFSFQGFKNMNATAANQFYDRIEQFVSDINAGSSPSLQAF